jgi:aminoglycoside phosphotransferase (APT) family kinase protein
VPHPEKRDLADTEGRLLRWLAAALPEGADFRVDDLRAPANTGFSSDTLLFDLAWREGDHARSDRLVVRLQPRGFVVFPTYDLTIQVECMRALGRTDVPVPEVLFFEADPRPLGAPFYVMRQVDGWAPSDNPPMHQSGAFFELAPEEREAVWWSGVRTMARIHRHDPDALGLAFLGRRHPGKNPLDVQLNYYEYFLDWGMGDRRRYPILQAALDYLRRNAPEDEPRRLCWGDSRLSNLLYRGTDCAAVLDWEMAFLGNPVQDLAWWNMADLSLTEGIGVPRLPGLPSYEETAARWADWTGLPTAHLRYYEILALFRFAVVMARIGLQMKHYEVLPADHSMDVANLASETLARRLVIAGV